MSKSASAKRISFPENSPQSRESRHSRVPAWLFWFLLLFLTGAAGVFSVGAAGKIPFLFILALPFFSLLNNRIVGKHLTAAFTLPVHADKNQPLRGALTLQNHGLAACSEVQVQFQIRNLLTGEISRHTAILSAPARGSSSASFTFTSAHCGMLEFKVTGARLYSWFGLFGIDRIITAAGSLLILPETFPADIRISLPYSENGDEESRNPLRGTDDPSEIRSFREYRPGDPVRQIHWKLSAKRDQPVLKEISRPVSRTLLVFWDQSSRLPAEAADALAEAFASTVLSLSVQKIPFMMGWRNAGGLHLEAVTDESAVTGALSLAMRNGVSGSDAPEKHDPASTAFAGDYARTLWFSGCYPFAEEFCLTQESTVLLCNTEMPASGERLTIFFRPDETKQVFRSLSV